MSAPLRVATALAAVALLAACEGLGLPVVGPLPEPIGNPGEMTCSEISACDRYLPEEPELWSPPSDPLAAAGCPELVRYALRGDAALDPNAILEALLVPPRSGEGPLELRCVELSIEVPDTARSFEFDLRSVTLEGVHVEIVSEARGRVLLGTEGTISQADFSIHGPIEMIAERAVLWGARVSLEPGRHTPAGSLLANETQFVRLNMGGEGTFAMRRSALRGAQVRASVFRSELSSWANVFVSAATVEVFEADVFQAHVESGHFIAAAGAIRYSEFFECGEIILAAVNVSQTRIADTEVPVLLSASMILNSYVQADLRGSARIVQCALLSDSIDLEGGTVANSALCGVDELAIAAGDAVCVRCDAGAPADLCVSVHREALCPGFESATCSRGPRPEINRGI